MIDNLISDLIKQIWVNLELYFKTYEFFNFRDFLIFFNFAEFKIDLFELNSLKYIFYRVLRWQLTLCKQKGSATR